MNYRSMNLVMKAAGFVAIQLVSLVLVSGRALSAEVDFENDILPIFEDRCVYCHGEEEQESGLRLDQRAHMLRGGDSGLAAITPGHPEKSYLMEVIQHDDDSVRMPPDDDALPEEEIALLKKWIEQGAVWPGQMDTTVELDDDHWAFQPVQRPTVPSDVSPENTTQVQPVDAFLLSKLQQVGLHYSEPAAPRDLLRRVSITLTGLPPTPDEMRQFLSDYEQNAASAYEVAVDRLLASPHFGERWAQHWLDVIRWAETNGSEANLYRKNAWVYRDYVVRSFNEDKPYDQFVQEQIAGDSMGAGEATGFLVAGPHVPAATVGREPTAIRQARADRMDEIMQTVGASVMGVTMGCARCHNHKFDPITIQDYYAMTAVFQDVEFGSRKPEYAADHPLRQRGQELWKQIHAQRQLLRPDGGWEENWGAFREIHFKPITTRAIRIRFKMPNVGLDELEVLGINGLDVNLAAATNGTRVSGYPEEGIENRNPIERLNDGEYGTMTWRAKVDDKQEERPWVRYDFDSPQTINRLRLSSNREYFYDTDYLTKKPYLPKYQFDVDVLTEDGDWQPWTGTWAVNTKLLKEHPERKQVLAKIQHSIDQLAEEGPRPSFVGRFIDPVVTRVLLRGSPESPRDEVMPSAPVVFDGTLDLDSSAPGPKRRREFAEWLTSSQNPLTARVMVNRVWHHVFGSGLVPTTSDFGRAGAPPTHPELLDWLAAEFMSPQNQQTSNWSTKSLIRMLVMSQAFQQTSTPNAEGLAKDAGSTLLWRFPPRRMEAEVIRDSILLASGKLNLKLGGRSYRIHNEKKTYAQWEVVDNHGNDTWRRMLYQERMRRVDDQMFTAFDFPDCGQVRAKRPVSTTPLQALNLMNSDFVIEQSELIAQRAQDDAHGDMANAIDRCFDLLLGRPPIDDERQQCLAVAGQRGLPIVCRALINSNEMAFLP
ncbi:PSD1 and planctomycete cytochrome C domain-containing protein [Rhodopirellula sp. JC740]|uniref:PSD1 and planctomycete cytochrome C domain-containing protein n=1 Tax=Rhodopirellula halodulae TaxID=2894198 RepID=A0ABS8NIY5_9BACT|nr:PSD1 and planctomycete cytochrome C domain-containing protein [Rhodopirellula sp. JC740]MCC9643359.1 PSD1 and planctomycete cytochrome C domain-containing protein [Rhodopirellula sp. JC740]